MSFGVPLSEEQGERLNPYSTGRYSVSIFDSLVYDKFDKVLILILLEDTL